MLKNCLKRTKGIIRTKLTYEYMTYKTILTDRCSSNQLKSQKVAWWLVNDHTRDHKFLSTDRSPLVRMKSPTRDSGFGCDYGGCRSFYEFLIKWEPFPDVHQFYMDEFRELIVQLHPCQNFPVSASDAMLNVAADWIDTLQMCIPPPLVSSQVSLRAVVS